MSDQFTHPKDELPLEASPEIASVSHSELSNKRKFLFIGGIIAAVLAIIMFSSWAVYALWYQNPDKVVADALANALSAKSMTFTATAEGDDEAGNKNNFAFSGKASYVDGANMSLKFGQKVVNTTKETVVDIDAAVTPGGDSYIKVDNVQVISAQVTDELVKMTTKDPNQQSQVATIYSALLEPIFITIDSKWIKLSADNIKSLDGKIGEEYECIQSTVESIANKSDLMQEIGGRYYDNKFIKIQKSLGTVNGKMGYVIGIDSTALQAFLGSLKSTKLYKELRACSPKGDNPLDMNVTDIKDILDAVSIELWIDQWSHHITTMKVKLADNKKSDWDNYTYDVAVKFNTTVKIEIPKEATPFSDILPGLGQLFGGESKSSASTMLFSDLI